MFVLLSSTLVGKVFIRSLYIFLSLVVYSTRQIWTCTVINSYNLHLPDLRGSFSVSDWLTPDTPDLSESPGSRLNRVPTPPQLPGRPRPDSKGYWKGSKKERVPVRNKPDHGGTTYVVG